jgi:hypothetical protein
MGNKKNTRIILLANILIVFTMINDVIAYKEWWEEAKVNFIFFIFW